MNELSLLRNLMVLLLNKLAETKAREEIVLKTQAHFLATVTNGDWKPIFEDIRKQVQEAAQIYREQFLNEWLLLQEREQKNPPAEGGGREGR